MIKVVVLYEQAPDAGPYVEHAELCRAVPGGTFRHGPIFGAVGPATHAYLAEWEFPDEETFSAAIASDEFMATGQDARERGFPRPTVQFVRLD